MNKLWQDLRYGARMLLKTPSMTAIVIAALSLGIGANTAVFSLVDAFLMRSPAVRDPQQLVLVRILRSNNRIRTEIPYSAFEQFRDLNHSLSGIAAYESAFVNATVNDQAEVIPGDFVSGDYFDVLGVSAIRGRTFTAAEDRLGQTPVVVISYRYWQRQFAAESSVIGKTIFLRKTPVNVIGVMPPDFTGLKTAGRTADVILPQALRSELTQKDIGMVVDRGDNPQVVARLRPGVSREQASIDLDIIYQEFFKQAAGLGASRQSQVGTRVEKIELKSGLRGDSELAPDATTELRVLLLTAVIVLLIASANVAGVLLARALGRTSEITIRQAVGASRGRLIRQLLTESVLLALLGGTMGLLFAQWAVRVMQSIISQGLPLSLPFEFNLDVEMLVFTGAVSLATGLLFGLAPAVLATKVDLNKTLKGNAAGNSSTPLRLGFGKALVIAQVALSLALLIGTGLMLRSIWQLYAVDTGFERDKVLTITAFPILIGYERERALNLDRELLERLTALPGVESASLSTAPLYTGAGAVGPRFFETEGIGLLAGREFLPTDTMSSPKVAIISESMARKFFPNQNPLGQYFSWELGGGYNIRPMTGDIQIVGVARDIKHDLWSQDWLASFYFPYTQAPQRALGQVQFLVRSTGNPATLIEAVKREIKGVEKDLGIVSIKTQAEEMNEKYLGGERSLTTLLSLFGGLAVILAATGLYGTMSCAVGRRTKELGIRLALGAQAANIRWAVLRETLSPVAAGIVVGIPLALGATRLISSMLFGVKATDPPTVLVAVLVVVAVAFVAGLIPARRATKVDPLVALRYE